MIDLRQEMDDFIEEYGWPILYQRTDRRIRCKCWDARYREADSHCKVCLGAGWLIRLERHKIRSDAALQPVTYPNLHESTPIGNAWVSADVFYFKHAANPRVGDTIIEVGWRGRRPTNIKCVYEVNHIQPKRGNGGRTEYWEVYVKAIPFDSSKYKIALTRYGNQIAYQIPGS